jgi:uncharacterized protein YjbI with pentapeptide repeats
MLQPEGVPIRINVGGNPFLTSLHTLMKGARLGGVDFQALCHKILGPASPLAAAARGTCSLCPRRTRSMAWSTLSTPTRRPGPAGSSTCALARRARCPLWRQGRCAICDTRRAGLAELADGLEQLVDWRRHELQALLVRPSSVFHGARLRCQDLSRLGFGKCSLGGADLSECTLAGCAFDGADMVGANLGGAKLTGSKLPGADLSSCNLAGADVQGVDLSTCNLRGANLRTNLSRATLPPWNSGLMEGVTLAGATGWKPAVGCKDSMKQAKLKGANLQDADLKRVDLSNADLSGANLAGADLSGCILQRGNLGNADLSGATLTGANLSGCNL